MLANTFRENLMFLKKYIHSPKQIGSIMPSSKYLASKLVSSLEWEFASAVAELGAGTGAVTKFIQKSNRTGAQILLFEKDLYLQEKLRQEFPEYGCYSDALQVRYAMKSCGIQQLDSIVSGLPFFNFPQRIREQLLEEINLALKPNGLFVAFQYSLQMKAALKEKFELESITFVPWNIPPAFVYVCRKK